MSRPQMNASDGGRKEHDEKQFFNDIIPPYT